MEFHPCLHALDEDKELQCLPKKTNKLTIEEPIFSKEIDVAS